MGRGSQNGAKRRGATPCPCDFNHTGDLGLTGLACSLWGVLTIELEVVTPLVRYTVFRMAILFAVVVLGWLAGMRGALLIAVSLIVSMLVSYIVLRGPRLAATNSVEKAVQGRVERKTARRTETSIEDDANDDASAQSIKDADN